MPRHQNAGQIRANNSLECIYSNVFFYETRLTNKTYTHKEVKGRFYSMNTFYHAIQNHLPFSLLHTNM
jgi:hypothetical protein